MERTKLSRRAGENLAKSREHLGRSGLGTPGFRHGSESTAEAKIDDPASPGHLAPHTGREDLE
jgi:hypothetical protein